LSNFITASADGATASKLTDRIPDGPWLTARVEMGDFSFQPSARKKGNQN
jgi:hypothetical protein